MRNVMLAATQFASTHTREGNLAKAEAMVRAAAAKGAQVILLQELFEGDYFCQVENYDYLLTAEEYESSPTLARFQKLAAELKVVLPISFFEAAGTARFNSLCVIDADGKKLGLYRKTHIPTGACYEEKFYFSPGDTGFKVFNTAYGRLGVAICWDQWFPECARIMALKGAEFLMYPTAIGSEPVLPKDSKDHWQHVMQGHAAANIIPVVASNRIGVETAPNSSMRFFGSSFIADEYGELVETLGRDEEGILVHTFDLDRTDRERLEWGVFRDRRPEMYEDILTLDGKEKSRS